MMSLLGMGRRGGAGLRAGLSQQEAKGRWVKQIGQESHGRALCISETRR